ncbi:alpha/beta hydrolase [Haloarchaeobius litoreus]|uniref:Alpha/beta hydrolase n=1 Tax=Haloarchaeobius litoreus TaxID=755306 RepID=A0ABD6DEP1_9EURY|nr:alpha/beta hydrolase [Haloarchaeobius litoreus]
MGYDRRSFLSAVGAAPVFLSVENVRGTPRDLRSISYGQTRTGEIDASDPSGYRGNYEPVTFEGEAGDEVTITMTSDDDPYLVLLDPNGDQVARNDDDWDLGDFDSRIEEHELGMSGEYTIVATSFDYDARFSYELTLERVGQGGGGGSDLRSISYGQTLSGEIDESDPDGYRGHYEPVTFEGDAGDVVTITMTSGDDPYLQLLDPNGTRVAHNDDHRDLDDWNARIERYELRESGEYTIVATSFSSYDTFPYELSLERVETGGGGGSGTDLRSIAYGQTRSGEIDWDDPTGYRGNYEPVTFEGEAGDEVTITMTSDGDPYLQLLDPSGDLVAENDDDWDLGDYDSRIEGHELAASGEYTIVATSFDSDASLTYELSLERVETGGGGGGGGGSDLRSISYGQTLSGEIDDGDPTGYRGDYEPVTFEGDAGDVVTITMTSDDDPYLQLLDPSGDLVAENDDDWDLGDFDSRIEDQELAESGEYTIVATSYSDDATFEYELTLERVERGGSGGGGGGSGLRSIAYGQTRTGRIDDGDPTGYRGHYEPVTFEGSAGDVVTITMTSDDDPYLILVDPNGEQVAYNDDDWDLGDYDSRIERYELETSGEYTIVATSFSDRDTFEYELSLERIAVGDGGGDTGGTTGETHQLDIRHPVADRGVSMVDVRVYHVSADPGYSGSDSVSASNVELITRTTTDDSGAAEFDGDAGGESIARDELDEYRSAYDGAILVTAVADDTGFLTPGTWFTSFLMEPATFFSQETVGRAYRLSDEMLLPARTTADMQGAVSIWRTVTADGSSRLRTEIARSDEPQFGAGAATVGAGTMSIEVPESVYVDYDDRRTLTPTGDDVRYDIASFAAAGTPDIPMFAGFGVDEYDAVTNAQVEANRENSETLEMIFGNIPVTGFFVSAYGIADFLSGEEEIVASLGDADDLGQNSHDTVTSVTWNTLPFTVAFDVPVEFESEDTTPQEFGFHGLWNRGPMTGGKNSFDFRFGLGPVTEDRDI